MVVTGVTLVVSGSGTACRWRPHGGATLPAEMRTVAATARPYALVRLVGTLEPTAAEPVRAALLTFLADQPTAVVVDLSALSAPDPAALALFAAAAREAARWAISELVICAPPPPMLGGRWYDPELTLAGSLAETGRRLAELSPTAAHSAHLALAPVPGSARRARELVTDRCRRWDVDELGEPARIAATEMINNVVAHAGTAMELRLRFHDNVLHLAVRDHSPTPPTYAGPASATSPGGRGLQLIDTVTRQWGASALADGKVVWAMLHPEDERLPAGMGG